MSLIKTRCLYPSGLGATGKVDGRLKKKGKAKTETKRSLVFSKNFHKK